MRFHFIIHSFARYRGDGGCGISNSTMLLFDLKHAIFPIRQFNMMLRQSLRHIARVLRGALKHVPSYTGMYASSRLPYNKIG
jgi:hypothetical protein